MLKVLKYILTLYLLSLPAMAAEENAAMDETHVHIEQGVVYCDVQTFDQEAYILKVIGSGSPMTVFWQFEVVDVKPYWPDSLVASVRLGRQVIPDLVTKRWLMRDLSGGVLKNTSDAQEAMRFLTEMNHAAVVDVSLLNPQKEYSLRTKLFMYEGEQENVGWWSLLINQGEDMGTVFLVLPIKGAIGGE